VFLSDLRVKLLALHLDLLFVELLLLLQLLLLDERDLCSKKIMRFFLKNNELLLLFSFY
jgi:hypothetical protein